MKEMSIQEAYGTFIAAQQKVKALNKEYPELEDMNMVVAMVWTIQEVYEKGFNNGQFSMAGGGRLKNLNLPPSSLTE